MGTLWTLVAAVVTALLAAGLVVRAGARLPRVPSVELSLLTLIAVLLMLTVDFARGAAPQPWQVALAMVAWLVFLLLFPSGRPQPAWSVWIVVGAALVIASALWWRPAQSVAPAGFVLAFVALSVGQFGRYHRRSSVAERQATKWLLLGLVPALGIFLGIGFISTLPAADPSQLEEPWYTVLATLGMWMIPIAATTGILLEDRGPVDELVRIAVTVVGTAFVASVAYVVAIDVTGAGWAAAIACAAVVPAWALFLRAGTALAYARGPQRPLARLPHLLSAARTPSDVSSAVASTLVTALGLAFVEVRIDDAVVATARPRQTEPGRESARTDDVRVRFQDEQVAVLVLSPRPGETTLTPRDRRIVDRVALVAGPALHGVRAARRADDANRRLAAARDEERRRLHADLHDELGPSLAGLALTAGAAAGTMASDPTAAGAMLRTLEEGITATVGRVREIAYDLRPPELAAHGLERILMERLGAQGGTPAVHLRCRLGSTPISDEIQLAAVRIVLEAVANVRRHADARNCNIEIDSDDEHLHIAVDDDGVGPRPGASPGIGLASIEARAREFGGTMFFGPGSGGARLVVRIPLGGTTPC